MDTQSDPASGAGGAGGSNQAMLAKTEQLMKEAREFQIALMELKFENQPAIHAAKTSSQVL